MYTNFFRYVNPCHCVPVQGFIPVYRIFKNFKLYAFEQGTARNPKAIHCDAIRSEQFKNGHFPYKPHVYTKSEFIITFQKLVCGNFRGKRYKENQTKFRLCISKTTYSGVKIREIPEKNPRKYLPLGDEFSKAFVRKL